MRALKWVLIASAMPMALASPTSAAQPVPTERPLNAAYRLPAPAAATIDDDLSIEGADISAKTDTTRMTVETMVNGQGPYRFVVDSGADSSVVGSKLAKSLGLAAGRPAVLHSITSTDVVGRVKVDELAFGLNRATNLVLPALDERDLGGDGLIGIDALANQRLMLDFEKRVIKVEEAGSSIGIASPDNVVSARRRSGQLILTQVHALSLPIQAMIDTGSEVTIGNSALRDILLPGNQEKFSNARLTGVTGVSMKIQIARIAELKIGSITLTSIPIAFADVPPFALFGLDKEPAILIGTDLMSVFRRVSLDFRDRKVRFQLRRCGIDGVLINRAETMSGTRILSGNKQEVCARGEEARR